MRKILASMLLLTLLTTGLAPANATTAGPAAAEKAAIHNDFSYQRLRADYEVRADASSTVTESHEILLKTKAAVEGFSQIHLGYSEKMEELEVLTAYTLAADGQRHDVAPERIYTQESPASAAAPIYADHKVRVIVFPNLAPGARLVYQTRLKRNVPHFPGYFGLWHTFSVFSQYEDAEITLTAPADLPIHVHTRDVQGSDRPQLRNGQAHWRWRYRRHEPLKVQSLAAPAWTFSPTIMASTYGDWAQVARAYQLKASPAAQVTPAIKALAQQITAGIDDRHAQAAALYHWVAQNIRYVAVYLGNGGLEPNTAQSVLDHRYGDCKDHVVLLEALLAARGIASSPALIGAGAGPLLPEIPMLRHFNHVITYLPEWDLHVDSTSPWARFGQLPMEDLGAPVLHTQQERLTRTPHHDQLRNYKSVTVEFVFDELGNMRGRSKFQLSDTAEIPLRGYLSQLNSQNLAVAEQGIMAACGIDGEGHIEMLADPLDLSRPFNFSYAFQAKDHTDLAMVGGMVLPHPPGHRSLRTLAASNSAPTNDTPFRCDAGLQEETYHVEFPPGVPIIAIPADQKFRNAAGEYQLQWTRQGQRVSARHRLELNAMRGKEALCQPEDYPALRALLQQAHRGFRGQIIYGELKNQALSHTAHR